MLRKWKGKLNSVRMDGLTSPFNRGLFGNGKKKNSVRMDRVRQKLFCFSPGHNVYGNGKGESVRMDGPWAQCYGNGKEKLNSVRMDRVRQKLFCLSPGHNVYGNGKEKLNSSNGRFAAV
ncbi:hypothetical protein TNIN_112441 [Trichonephila inaurata madagascariensis]|uniref:Uncharacterized protein n=1 Tax=Trichonephila inaurata madagascariensis TaxID=2747483 RepID=A0A8X6XBP2_9ARAC|nr:hypothetical protein TNIN_112441 [Trichonephila inaurata madagascariensis]